MQNLDSKTQRRVLLVEGSDDKHVVKQLRNRSGLKPNFGIIVKGGKDSLLDSIEAEVDVPERRVLGILLDADDDLEGRWQAVTNRLRQEVHLNLPDLPAQPQPKGTILQGRIRIGIWLMPDNLSTGELEDFVGSMIPSGDPIWPRAEAFIDGHSSR